MNGRDIRLSRLFNGNENAVVIAIDHGYMDGPIPGMEDLRKTVTLIDPCVDAVLLSPGMMKVVGGMFVRKGAPVPIVRLNWSTVFCFEWGYSKSRTVHAFRVKDAVALGAQVVLASLTLRTGDEANDAHNVEVFASLANEAREYGIPIVGLEQMHDIVLRGTRILAELGADLIKTFHTHKFRDVVQGCPLPILGLGGRSTPKPLDSLVLARREIDEGARGVVFGRNAIQRPDPQAYQRALCEVVKRGMKPEDAVKKFGL
jgi:DhnA family fructose-bisphosphate aldolase class Ia